MNRRQPRQSRPTPFLIRDAAAADAPALARLLTNLGYPRQAPFVRRQLLRLAGLPGERILVAVEAGRVVGLAALHLTWLFPEAEPSGRITALCVAAARRSRGIGARLLAAAEESARRAGCARMEVTSRAERIRAHAFYERQGYTERPKYLRKALAAAAVRAAGAGGGGRRG